MSVEQSAALSLLLLAARVLPFFHLGLPGSGIFAHLGKLTFALLCTLLLTDIVPAPQTLDPTLLLRELTVGLSLGLCAHLVLHTATMAGRLIDSGTAVDDDGTPTTRLYVALASMLFFAFDGPLLLFSLLMSSYTSFPLLPRGTALSWSVLLARELATAIGFGLSLASPVLVARIAVGVAVAMFGRVGRLRVRLIQAPTGHLVTAAMVLLGIGLLAELFEQHTIEALTDLPGSLETADE